MMWCWKSTSSKSEAYVLSLVPSPHCRVTLGRLANAMNTILTPPIKAATAWCYFDNQIRSLIQKCFENSKTFGNIRQLYYKAPEFWPVTEILLCKINISFFCVCWVPICIFYSVWRTSVTVPLKWQLIDSVLLTKSRLLLSLREPRTGPNFIRETQPDDHSGVAGLDGHRSSPFPRVLGTLHRHLMRGLQSCLRCF